MRRGLVSVALGVAGITLAARVMGFGRSLVFSKTVGDTCLGDVYNAANTLPNVLFEIVAGGVLAGVVVPVVARHAGARRREADAHTVSALITWTLLVLTPAGLAALAGAGLYGRAFAKADCAGSAEVVAALLVMFVPQIWLYGLAVVSAGVLQAHHRFAAAAFAPLLSSAVVITAYLVFARLSDPEDSRQLDGLTSQALAALGWGTTAGVLALALTTLVPLARLGLRLRPRLRFAAGDQAVIIRIAAAGLAGLVLQQLALLLIGFLSQRSGDQGALTRFTWSYALYLLPYAVLAAPLLQTIFPRLAAAAESGPEAVRGTLIETGPVVVAAAWLGAALLAATAVPVARVFVLGPGSGRTAALAWPIVAFAPAVVGFSLLGLATRTLLAQHRARAAGLATASGWLVVIVAVLVAWSLVPPAWLVAGIAGSISAGMILGGILGWLLIRRGAAGREGAGLTRPMLGSAGAAVLAAGACAVVGQRLADASLLTATLAALGLAAAATAIFAGVLRLTAPGLLAQIWRLRREPTPVEVES